MPTVAEQLRIAREGRKLTISQAAETTKIRTDHIRALEDGNYDVFSAPVYIRGFVRSYAMLLKLNVAQIMADLDDELSGTEKYGKPPPLSEHSKGTLDFVMLQLSKVNWNKGVGVLIVLAVIGTLVAGVMVWRNRRVEDPLSGLPPAVYKPASSDAGNTVPLTLPPAQRH
jgi:cytoskeleton protein RodZ